jgi:hypothetical protein
VDAGAFHERQQRRQWRQNCCAAMKVTAETEP